ncbi:MAG: SCO family protein [candidate division NC10 bacterium]|nr:SCO family protein [candidate division NC10 bacterium]
MNSQNFLRISASRERIPLGVLGVALLLLCTSFTTIRAAWADALPQKSPPFESDGAALSRTPSLPVIRVAPDFILLNTVNQPVHLSDLRGQVVLISFIYTSCTSACPLLTARMSALWGRLKRDGAAARQVRFLSITVDPARDSAAALERYVKRFKADPARWSFLREERQKLQPVLAAYDEWTRPQPDGEIDHPARLYLIDRRGRLREIYSISFFDERQAFLDIQALLHQSP